MASKFNTSDDSKNEIFDFFGLPRELRNRIYSCLLTQDTMCVSSIRSFIPDPHISMTSHGAFNIRVRNFPHVNLQVLNRQFRHELMEQAIATKVVEVEVRWARPQENYGPLLSSMITPLPFMRYASHVEYSFKGIDVNCPHLPNFRTIISGCLRRDMSRRDFDFTSRPHIKSLAMNIYLSRYNVFEEVPCCFGQLYRIPNRFPLHLENIEHFQRVNVWVLPVDGTGDWYCFENADDIPLVGSYTAGPDGLLISGESMQSEAIAGQTSESAEDRVSEDDELYES